MFKLLALTCIFLALSSVYTQSCTTTKELRTLYGFGNTVTTPTAASGINYCKSIKAGTVCCTASDINSIGDKSTAFVKNLTSLVSTRDTYIKRVKAEVIPQLLSNINNFVPIAQDFTDFIDTVNLTGIAGYDELVGSIGEIIDFAGFLLSNLTTIKSGYVSYQKARTTCVIEMVSLQNAAYCLACDPNAGTKGYTYSSNTYNFALSSSVCNRLQGSCNPYIFDSIGQNILVGSSYFAEFLNVLGEAIQKLMTGDNSQIKALNAALESAVGPKDASVGPANTPQYCESGNNCTWICNGLFYNGQVNQLSLALGGTAEDGSRRLSESNDRNLAGTTWSPDRDESGVTVTFKDDPAGTNNSSGMIIGNVFVSMIAVISAILMF